MNSTKFTAAICA